MCHALAYFEVCVRSHDAHIAQGQEEAYTAMAYIVMNYMIMAYIVVAYIVVA